MEELLKNWVVTDHPLFFWILAGLWLATTLFLSILLIWIIGFLVWRIPYRKFQIIGYFIQYGIASFIFCWGFLRAIQPLPIPYTSNLIIPLGYVVISLFFFLRFYKTISRPGAFHYAIVSRLLITIVVIFGILWGIQVSTSYSFQCIPNCMSQNAISADLRGLDLSNVNFTGSNLRNANLSNANLSGADLSGANLSSAILRGANLSNTYLIGANLESADLRDANLENTDFSGADLSRSDLTGVNLNKTRLNGAIFTQAKLVGVILHTTSLTGVSFNQANLTSANLENISLNGASLSGANLSGANLISATLTGALLNTTNLTGIMGENSNFSGANLIGANLSSSNLTNSKLIGANLIGAQLKGANLHGANLFESRLLMAEWDANDIIVDPILKELNELRLKQLIQNVDLGGIKFTEDTIWPEGKSAYLVEKLGETAIYKDNSMADIVVTGQPETSKLTNLLIGEYLKGTKKEFTIGTVNTTVEKAFESLCVNKTINIVLSNRLITTDEEAACKQNNREVTALSIGLDKIILVSNPQSKNFVTEITQDELNLLSTATQWSQVNPKWPPETIYRFLPPFESLSQLLDQDYLKILKDIPNIVTADQSTQIRSISDTPYSMGIISYASYLLNRQTLLEIPVISNSTNLEVTPYLFTQPLYLYLNSSAVSNDSNSVDFLDFYLKNINDKIEEAGYLPQSKTSQQKMMRTWASSIKEK